MYKVLLVLSCILGYSFNIDLAVAMDGETTSASGGGMEREQKRLDLPMRELITATELHSSLSKENLRIFDCTGSREWISETNCVVFSGRSKYEAGHIPGSEYLDLAEELSNKSAGHLLALPTPEEFQRVMSLKGIGPDTDVVVYSKESVDWATRVWWLLKYHGFDRVWVLDGGFDSWQRLGLPISTDPSSSTPNIFPVSIRRELLADKDEVNTSIASNENILLSSVTPSAFSGLDDSTPYFGRKGRIPGSLNLPYVQLLNEDGTFLPMNKAFEVLERYGVFEAKRVVAQGMDSVESTPLAFVLSNMGINYAVYDGALSEWTRNSTLPLKTGILNMVDVSVYGGGASGLEAALTLGRVNIKTAVFDDGRPRNKSSDHSYQMLTRDGMSPSEILSIGRAELAKYPAIRVVDAHVDNIFPFKGQFLSVVNGQEWLARKVVFATGVEDVLPTAPGFKELFGKKVLHCPYCHGYEVMNRPLGIVLTAQTMLGFYPALIRSIAGEFTVFTNSEIEVSRDLQDSMEFTGAIFEKRRISRLEETAEGVDVHMEDGAIISRHALFVQTHPKQKSDLSERLGCKLDDKGIVVVDPMQQTTIPGVFATGDTMSIPSSLPIAFASGNKTGALAKLQLVQESAARALKLLRILGK